MIEAISILADTQPVERADGKGEPGVIRTGIAAGKAIADSLVRHCRVSRACCVCEGELAGTAMAIVQQH